MSEERYVKQIVSDVMEMAAKIKFLEAKVAASESWNAECVADAQATVEAAISDRDKQQDISKALYQQVEALRRELEHAKKMEAVQKEVADNQTWHVRELRAALDAERANRESLEACVDRDVKKIKDLQSQLSQIQALVRALCNSGDRLLDDVIGTSDAADSLKHRIKQVRATLDATTPVEGGKE